MPTAIPNRSLRQLRSGNAGFKTRDENGPVIAGYFAVFNSPYEWCPGYVEQVAPGAFSATLGGDIRALADHDSRLVLGRTTAGTLTLQEDEHGLYGEIRINENDSDAMNLYARVQRGDVTQCSFGFDIEDEEYIHDADTNTDLWVIRSVKLYEVSVVTFPAYEETSVEARQSDKNLEALRSARWRKKMKERLKHGS
jgi:HK97 family phage prohead protease